MKKYKTAGKIIVISLLAMTGILSCTENTMDRINRNPNNPLDAPAKFLITELSVSTPFSISGGDFSVYSSVYIEHEVGINNQHYRAELRIGEPSTPTTYNNVWNAIYTNIRNAKVAIMKCEEDPAEKGNPVTEAIARIYLAYNAALLTDVFGDTPFSETGILNPDGTPAYMQPKIDTQASIYAEVHNNLNKAITLLNEGKAKDTGSSGAIDKNDLIYSGNALLWYKAANALKARYTMRLLNRSTDVTKDLNDVIGYISKSFKSAKEECKLAIYDGEKQQNPLLAFSSSRNSLAASESLIDKFKERKDPRLNQAFARADSDGDIVVGKGGRQATHIDSITIAPNGTVDEIQNKYSTSMALWSAKTPTQLISYHELKFLEAEALCRLNGAGAEDALKEAVRASFVNLGSSIQDAIENWKINGSVNLDATVADTYFTSNVKPLFDANKLKETMIQKYLAFYGASGESTEAYSDYRRLKSAGENFIQLKNPLNESKKLFPLRFGYGHSDVSANKAVNAAFGDGQYVYSEPVWWAKGTR